MEYAAKGKELPDWSTERNAQASLFERYLQDARAIVDSAVKAEQNPTYVVSDYQSGNVRHEETPEVVSARWFVTRAEAYSAVKENSTATAKPPSGASLPGILIQVGKTEKREPSPVKRPSSESIESKSGPNPFEVKLTKKRNTCLVSSTGRAIVPLSVVSMVQEKGVEFRYHSSVSGSIEFTAVLPGMEFHEHVKYMKQHKELFPPIPTRLMKLMGRRWREK